MVALRASLLASALCAAMLLGSCSSQPATPPKPPAKVIKGGTLIDGTIRKPIPNAVVIVEGSTVAAAGSAADIKIPEGSTVTNATGLFVTPTQTGAVLATGAPANIYLLNANPLDNPFVLATPTRVMKAGEWTDAARK